LHSNHRLAAVFELRCQDWTDFSAKGGGRQAKSSLRAACEPGAVSRGRVVRAPWQQFVAAGENVLERAEVELNLGRAAVHILW